MNAHAAGVQREGRRQTNLSMDQHLATGCCNQRQAARDCRWSRVLRERARNPHDCDPQQMW